jgi:hypothetical protein
MVSSPTTGRKREDNPLPPNRTRPRARARYRLSFLFFAGHLQRSRTSTCTSTIQELEENRSLLKSPCIQLSFSLLLYTKWYPFLTNEKLDVYGVEQAKHAAPLAGKRSTHPCLLKLAGLKPDQPVLPNRFGKPMTRTAVQQRLPLDLQEF